MDLQLRGKVVVVTGGAQGIGAAVAEACATEGAIPVIVDRNSEAAQNFAARLRNAGRSCELLPERPGYSVESFPETLRD